MLNKAKFQSRESRGIHEDAGGFREWARYANDLNETVERHRKATAHMSRHRDDDPTYVEARELARQRPEDATHVIVCQMMSSANWAHLRLLHDLTGENPVDPSHAGKFYAIIVDWLLWYDANAHHAAASEPASGEAVK